MRRFKDLNIKQKKEAIDFLFKRIANQFAWDKDKLSPDIKDKVKDITTQIRFCGCSSCQTLLFKEVLKDNQLKETILAKAQTEAEGAYYPEQTDTIVKVV